MCKVKQGALVATEADLQNLVTSVILRQTSDFTVGDICKRTNDSLLGSAFADSEAIMHHCYETISALYSIDYLRAVQTGHYKLSIPFPSLSIV